MPTMEAVVKGGKCGKVKSYFIVNTDLSNNIIVAVTSAVALTKI